MIRGALRVRFVPFARLRELLAADSLVLELAGPASAGEAWAQLVAQRPELAPLAASTRLVRNGRFADPSEALDDGDELGLLPPYGGG
ncbi:MAG: MoaD/ThiS family protein [Vulcanimicrobiaceae bacterium]